jgi:hypothetical protein
MPDIPESITEIDARISLVRANLRELVDQSSADSGAADEELLSQRIADQEALLDTLTKRRAALSSPA